MSFNKVMLLGNLGQDPDLRYNPSGTPVCNFSLATNEHWLDKDGQKQQRTEWHRIVVWGKNGENCSRYLAKGRQVFVEGRIETRSWEGKDGQKRYTTEVIARNVQFIGTAPTSEADTTERVQSDQETQQSEDKLSSNQNPPVESYQVHTESNFTADDIPF